MSCGEEGIVSGEHEMNSSAPQWRLWELSWNVLKYRRIKTGWGFFCPTNQLFFFQVWWKGREIFPCARNWSDWLSVKLFRPGELEKALNIAQYLQLPQLLPVRPRVSTSACSSVCQMRERLHSVHLKRSLTYSVFGCVVPASFIWSHQKQ